MIGVEPSVSENGLIDAVDEGIIWHFNVKNSMRDAQYMIKTSVYEVTLLERARKRFNIGKGL